MKNLLHTIPEAMQARIAAQIKQIEQQYQVTVIYACESGSRAWGFASADSDYDVRFIYVNKLPWYLTIKANRDVIELPIIDELDMNGWDLRKALQLMDTNNPALLEWLQSPIVYKQHELAKELQTLALQCYSPIKAHYHYGAMARKNFRGYLQGDEVRYKKYLYVLRPLLAVKWIDADLAFPPPILFTELVDKMVDDPLLKADIYQLLALKKAATEQEYGAARPIIQQFIEQQLAAINRIPTDIAAKQHNLVLLNDFLYKTVLTLDNES